MANPDIIGVKGGYDPETAGAYDEKVTQEMNNEKQENTEATQEEIENLKILSVSKIIQEAIYDSNVTKSAYQFTDQETYTNTDFNDKTDTYVNMNTSFRYIKYNINGAGTLYNQLKEGNNFRTDSPKKVFENIKNRFVELGYNKKENEEGIFEEFDIQDDQDMLYVIGFFQAITEEKSPNASKKDFRIGPKTLTALLDNTNKLTYTKKPVETTPVIEENITTPADENKETTPIIEENTINPVINEKTPVVDENTGNIPATENEEITPTIEDEIKNLDTGINKELETKIEQIKMPEINNEIINENYTPEDKEEAKKVFEAYRTNLQNSINEINEQKTNTTNSYTTYKEKKAIYDKIPTENTAERMENNPKMEEMEYNNDIRTLENNIKFFEKILTQYENTKKQIQEGNAISGNINNFTYNIEAAKTATPIEKTNNGSTDNVFTEIENNTERFPSWKILTEDEKNIVKNIFEELDKTTKINEQKNIISKIEKKRIIEGLRQVIVQKIFTEENKEKRQEIGKITVEQKNKITQEGESVETVKAIKQTYEIIEGYTIEPKIFSIKKIEEGEKIFNDSKDETKPLIERVTQVNFYIVKNNTENIGTIGFDIYGKLITPEIEKDGKTYTVTQEGTTINITEKQKEEQITDNTQTEEITF